MKKIYLSALALSIGVTAFAQDARLELKADGGIKHILQNEKAPGDNIWNEDFTGGFPAGWTKGGTTNNGNDWVINELDLNSTNYPPSTYTDEAPIASTSGGKHMLFFGENITPVADRDAYFQTTAIPLTGQPSITVRFEQKFRLCCGNNVDEALNLVVSTDPAFPAGATTKEYNVINGIAINEQSPDAMVTSVNITDFTQGMTGDIYLRFHWAVGLSHYYWMIDDIEVMETEEHDLVAFNPYYGTYNVPYTRIPEAQIQPMDFAMEVKNVGAVDQTLTKLQVFVNGTLEATTPLADQITVAVGASDSSLAIIGGYTPALNNWGNADTVTLTITSEFTDAAPSNNTMSFAPFQTSEFIYAQDNYSVTPGNGGGEDSNNSGDFEFEAGNYFDIFADATAYGIQVMIGTDAVAGEEVDAVLYSQDPTTGDFTEVSRSQVIQTNGTETLANFAFDAPVNLTAGTSYFAAIHAGGNTEFFFGVSGSSASNEEAGGTTSLVYYPNMHSPNANYYTARTPMVRLSFDPAFATNVGINDVANNKVNFDVYPNPSTGEFNINLNKDMGATVNLMVKNVVGQTIINKQIAVTGNQVETISLAGYDKGVYFLTINNETVKLIVE